MTPPYLTQVELAVRWRISPRTLERWRWAGDGPRFIKIGGLVRYRLEDIEVFEATSSGRSPARNNQNSRLPANRASGAVTAQENYLRRTTLLFAQRAQVGFAAIRCNSLNYAILR